MVLWNFLSISGGNTPQQDEQKNGREKEIWSGFYNWTNVE
jgi:hypothetical protein